MHVNLLFFFIFIFFCLTCFFFLSFFFQLISDYLSVLLSFSYIPTPFSSLPFFFLPLSTSILAQQHLTSLQPTQQTASQYFPLSTHNTRPTHPQNRTQIRHSAGPKTTHADQVIKARDSEQQRSFVSVGSLLTAGIYYTFVTLTPTAGRASRSAGWWRASRLSKRITCEAVTRSLALCDSQPDFIYGLSFIFNKRKLSRCYAGGGTFITQFPEGADWKVPLL